MFATAGRCERRPLQACFPSGPAPQLASKATPRHSQPLPFKPALQTAEIIHRLARYLLRPGFKVEHLERNPTGIIQIRQHLEDRAEVETSRAGMASVHLVDVHVPDALKVPPHQSV